MFVRGLLETRRTPVAAGISRLGDAVLDDDTNNCSTPRCSWDQQRVEKALSRNSRSREKGAGSLLLLRIDRV